MLLKKLFLSITAIVFTVLFTVLLDRSLGLLHLISRPPELKPFDLVPGSRALYRTSEFQYVVNLNSLGLRGRDYPLKKPPGIRRILAVGDSFTFGWGVNLEDTWPYKLEKELNAGIKNPRFEVLNFGITGYSPREYLDMVKTAVPVYKPDYVIVGAVEGEDVTQLITWPRLGDSLKFRTLVDRIRLEKEIDSSRPVTSSTQEKITGYISRIYPNLYQLTVPYKILDVGSAFKSVMKNNIDSLSDEEMKHVLSDMKPDILEMFLKGNLNPSLFLLSGQSPKYFTQILNTADPLTRKAVNDFDYYIGQIRLFDQKYNTKTVILDIPYGIFAEKNHMETYRDMGFTYNPGAYSTDLPLTINRDAATMSGSLFIPNLSKFRQKCTGGCFYTYDDHLTAKGQSLLADSVAGYFLNLFNNKQ